MREFLCSFIVFFGAALTTGRALPVSWPHLHISADVARSGNHSKVQPLLISLENKSFVTLAVSGEIGVKCDEHIKMHPDDIQCPMACPFLRAEPTRLCQFKCVPETECNSDNPLASYANRDSMRCEACAVAGCHKCADARDRCAECQEGFFLGNDGACKSVDAWKWNLLWAILGVTAIIFTWYLFALFFLRANTNEEVMQEGLRYRYKSIARRVNEYGELQQIKLNANLMREENVVCGCGVMLHFRWMGMVVAWSVFAAVLFGIAGLVFWDRLGVFKGTPNSEKSYDVCEENVRQQRIAFSRMEFVYFVCTVIMYLVTFIGSLWFASYQRQAYREYDVKHLTQKDFVLKAEGFPVALGYKKVEEDYLRWFSEQPQFAGLDAVGVSVAWNFKHQTAEIHELIYKEFDIHTLAYGGHAAKEMELAATQAAESREKRTSRSCGCFSPQLTCIDAAFGVGGCPLGRAEEEPSDDDSERAISIEEMLEGLKTSGTVYVVFAGTKDQVAAEERCSENPLIFEQCGEKHTITLSETEAEPLAVIWSGYGTKRPKFLMSLGVASLLVFLAVILLDIFFYAPYVYYILSMSDVTGMSQGSMLSGLFLGLLITVCNQCIYAIIGFFTDRQGWTDMDAKDCYYCVKYTLAVFFNTLIDLATVLVLAQGYSVDQVMEQQAAADSTMSPKAIAEQPNIQKAIYEQLVLYIFPSCILLPFIAEPIGYGVLYQLYKALVRTRQEVTLQDAEQCLACPPYDLSRYGDVLVNMMLCCITLAFTYRDLWELFLYMLISMAVILCWDHVRVLRYSIVTQFPTDQMERAVQYMMALPSSCIVACLVFKCYGASHDGFINALEHSYGEGYLDLIKRSNVIKFMFLGFVVNLIFQWLLMRLIVMPRTEKKMKERLRIMKEEEEAAEGFYQHIAEREPSNYFNTNPVNCLRSKYIYDHSPPCMPYRIGKEHLLKRNESIGVYFEETMSPRIAKGITTESKTSVSDKIKKRANQFRAAANDFADGV
jgi:hypothetical protein